MRVFQAAEFLHPPLARQRLADDQAGRLQLPNVFDCHRRRNSHSLCEGMDIARRLGQQIEDLEPCW